MTKESSYLDHLERALRRRGLDASHTAEVIQEVTNHLTESGDRPRETFAAALVAADEPESDPEHSYEARTFRATATDEVEILTNLGRDGWELTGVRDFGLHARRPVEPTTRTMWEYARRTAVRCGPVLDAMEAAGWKPCGRWLTFHYFKRPEDASA
jgi:hypothetical protein